jgi:hypothetical protein
MDTNDPRFGEQFSELTNSLQTAMLLARQRAVDARTDMAAADQLYAAVARAVEAARLLQAGGNGEEQ